MPVVGVEPTRVISTRDFESLTRQTVRVSLCAICRAADSGNMPFAIAPFP